MQGNGIKAIFHYIPLHSSDKGKQFGKFDFTVTESVSKRIIRLPFYNGLESVIDKVINNSVKF